MPARPSAIGHGGVDSEEASTPGSFSALEASTLLEIGAITHHQMFIGAAGWIICWSWRMSHAGVSTGNVSV